MAALNNEEVKQAILDYIGKDGLKMMLRWYKKYNHVFPLIIEDGCPISTNVIYGMAIRNHIQEKFNAVPDKIKNWTIFEDYIYNMLKNILEKEKDNNS